MGLPSRHGCFHDLGEFLGAQHDLSVQPWAPFPPFRGSVDGSVRKTRFFCVRNREKLCEIQMIPGTQMTP